MNERPLKFRIYSYTDKAWHYFDIYEGYPQGIYGAVTPPQQFTGPLDKNGKEIYEGDILKELTNNETSYEIGVCQSIIGGWKIFNVKDTPVCWHGWKQEVIGNTIENKEFLQK